MRRHTMTSLTAKAVLVWVYVFASVPAGCGGGATAESDGSVAGDTGNPPPSCKPNSACRNDLDCGTGTCSGGACSCGGGGGPCYKDGDCGTGKCCNMATSQCYDCGVQADAGPTDRDHADVPAPADSGPKDGGTPKDTGFTPCTSDFQCSFPTPVCNTNEGRCVECLTDGDCSGGTCNTSTYTCNQGQDGGVPDGGGADSGGDGGTDPCSSYSCLCDSYCMVSGGNPTCVSGCRTINDCCSGKDCINGSCQSSTCISDPDCSGSTPYCDTSSGNCVECLYDSHCSSGFYCDQTSYVCLPSACNPPCDPSTEYCDESTGIPTCMPLGGKMCQPCQTLLDCLDLTGPTLTCGLFTKKCTTTCTSDSECQGFTCGLVFGYCQCP